LIAAPGLQAHAEQPQIEKIQTEETVQLETVKVSADFRQLDLQQIPSAITVIGEDQIQNRNADHLETVLSLAPNVNYSSGSSRGRYFQIRGIGERSQFIDPVNPSVGLIVDGIDLTGLGGAATLFDIQQVEVLRGPQGIAFGANALAGAINIKSKQPTKETEGYAEAKFGNYNSQGLGGAISGSLSDNVQARFAINQFKTDGYMNNTHLNREDTNNINETIVRAQVAWQVNNNNNINISLLKTDINNGYDAFSLDNNRTTYSNEPGKDTQDTNALAVTWHSKINNAFELQVNASGSQTDSEYSYDEDWAFGEYTFNDDDPVYTPDPCITSLGPCLNTIDGYSSFDQYFRDYSRNAFDIRLVSGQDGRVFNDSTEWVFGAYNSSKNESLIRNYTFDSQYKSEITTDSTALYSELTTQLSLNSRLIYGVRIENTSFDFEDNKGLNKSQSETLWGGKITLESMVALDHLTYLSFSRGFKAGSVNRSPDISELERLYDTEINHTIETGIKSSLLNDDLQTRLAVFFTQREDQQVKQSFLYYSSGKPKFSDYFANAGEGHNYGIELESTYQLSNTTALDLSIGLLKTEFIDYEFSSTDDNDNIITVSKNGRDQAHAPVYSASTAITHMLTPCISLRIETELKDSFYFSASHDEKSKAYQLWNASVNYTLDNLDLSLHGRNLTDKDYATRGFGFGNDPRDGYSDTQHIQLGDPRLISLQARYNF
jgi:outer membrane receptor protein involved in Fe transport